MKQEEMKAPKRLRIKKHSFILGVPEKDKLLKPGVYKLGLNMDEAMAIRLASEEFTHCVEILSDEPEPEPLGEVAEGPKISAGEAYQQERRRKAQLEYESRWGLSTAPAPYIK